ncbi:MAG: lysophospholipid acyltransferase family protein, partial [Bacteroidota bacterium]|nr:lysophospholipid acyltransferase family protein [Bacteroidota bacterium]
LEFMANKNNVIVMDVKKDLMESIQKLAEVLKSGNKIVIFPEGTRTKTGDLGEFKKTFAILSKELNIPVVPVSVKGAFKAFPQGARFPRPCTKIEINFLKPITPEGHTTDTLVDAVKQSISRSLGE